LCIKNSMSGKRTAKDKVPLVTCRNHDKLNRVCNGMLYAVKIFG
jgi:hypothetical protein